MTSLIEQSKRRHFSPPKVIVGIVYQTIEVEGDRSEGIAKKISWARRLKDCMLA